MASEHMLMLGLSLIVCSMCVVSQLDPVLGGQPLEAVLRSLLSHRAASPFLCLSTRSGAALSLKVVCWKFPSSRRVNTLGCGGFSELPRGREIVDTILQYFARTPLLEGRRCSNRSCKRCSRR